MARQSQSQHQLSLGPTLLPNHEQSGTVLPKQEQPQTAAPMPTTALPIQEPATLVLSADQADQLAALLIDEALTAARISNDEAAFALDVSPSLIRKMRSVNNRERMSHPQILRLASHHPRFYLELHRALNERTGWLTRAALWLQQQATAFFTVAAAR